MEPWEKASANRRQRSQHETSLFGVDLVSGMALAREPRVAVTNNTVNQTHVQERLKLAMGP